MSASLRLRPGPCPGGLKAAEAPPGRAPCPVWAPGRPARAFPGRPTRWNLRHRLSKVSCWLCRPMLGLYTVKNLPRFCSTSRQLGWLPRTWARGDGVGGVRSGRRGPGCALLHQPPPSALLPPPRLGSSPRDTHLVGEVEAVMGAGELQRPGVSLLPLQAAVHADLPQHTGVRGLGGMGGRGGGRQHHSPCRRRSAHPEGAQGPGTPAGSPRRSRQCPEPGLGRGRWGERGPAWVGTAP